jgi:hypothetical protein
MSKVESRPHARSWPLRIAITALLLVGAVVAFSFASRWFGDETDVVREARPAHLIGEIIQVEVRNACGVPGVAAQTRAYLRGYGFDVVEVGDHSERDLERSLVIDRGGDLAAAQKVARAMGIPEDRVIQEVRESYYLDASVIVGMDYQQLRPFHQ